MKISIAMATYNGADYIGAQLESFITQSRRPDELIVTDDQSSDSTVDIVLEFAARAPFDVRFEINSRRLGVMLNFDRALGLCSGELILLSDQDDVWFSDKISALERAADRNPDKGCIINDALLADGELRPTGATKLGQIRAARLPETMMVQGCCSAFRRDLLDCLLPIPASQQAHDNWLVQMADLLEQALRVEDRLQYYRRHGRNVSNCDVNRLVAPGYWQRLRQGLSRLKRRVNDSDGLDSEMIFYSAASAHLSERQLQLASIVGAKRLQKALARASSFSQLLASRQAIRSLPRRNRLVNVLRLWREGGYKHSGQISGAAKDLVVAPRNEISAQ
jgi:glycosyltransferase involved in cell wall biosynthesis